MSVSKCRNSVGKTAPMFAIALLGGEGEAVIRLVTDPLCAERERLELLLGEHERRQQKARLQHITEAWLPFDIGSHCLEGADIAVDGPQGNASFARELNARHRTIVPAQHLHQIEQPIALGRDSTSQCQILAGVCSRH
ncbi:hypothetical protein [Mesorhizobium amorphae]|uniref:hypothetical protein n=1 Tax=Mesorhizobium amorphae TaxID=71433 RepID=UPI003CC7272C